MKLKFPEGTSPTPGISQAKKIKPVLYFCLWKLRKVRVLKGFWFLITGITGKPMDSPFFGLKSFELDQSGIFLLPNKRLLLILAALNCKLWEGKNQASETLYMEYST